MLPFHSKYVNRSVRIITAGSPLRPGQFVSQASISSTHPLSVIAASPSQTDVIPALKSFIIKNI